MSKTQAQKVAEGYRLSFSEFIPLVMPSLLHAHPEWANPQNGTAWGINLGLATSIYVTYAAYLQAAAVIEDIGFGDYNAYLQRLITSNEPKVALPPLTTETVGAGA